MLSVKSLEVFLTPLKEKQLRQSNITALLLQVILALRIEQKGSDDFFSLLERGKQNKQDNNNKQLKSTKLTALAGEQSIIRDSFANWLFDSICVERHGRVLFWRRKQEVCFLLTLRSLTPRSNSFSTFNRFLMEFPSQSVSTCLVRSFSSSFYK